MPKILVADDSIAVRKVAERLLTEAGLGVVLAANGEEALAYLAKERPDVIVSDVIMPDKSGYEVCAFVRGNSMLSATPVLLISGIVNDEVTKQAESCRADGVLKKPFQGTSLKDRVLELIAKRQERAPAPAPKSVPAQTVSITGATDKGPRILDEQLETYRHASSKLKEVEDQLRAERARADDLAKRVANSGEQVGKLKESEALLAAERQRVTDLEAKVAKLERQASKVPELEAALKAEQEAALKIKDEAAGWQRTSGRVTELEAALHAERTAAEQLVQQLADMEKAATRMKDIEAKLAREEQRAFEFQQRAKDLEVSMASERQKGSEIAQRLHELEQAAMKVQEMEALLATERDRSGLLARRVSETEQDAENAKKRLEDMA
ncbi:MAG: response regulator, partial [Nitrospirae bacterium]|nr:response regulator [Nitrospirota bacterium]